MPLPRPKSPVAQAVVPVVGGIAFFAVLALILWGVAALVSGGGGVQVKLGDNVFRPGQAERVAKQVADGGPLLFPGLVGTAGTRAIGVYHVGNDPFEGWKVFSIAAPGQAATCLLEVDRQTLELVDPCSGRHYPSDGSGLEPVPWAVDEQGNLVIDLTPGGEPGQGPTTVPAPSTTA